MLISENRIAFIRFETQDSPKANLFMKIFFHEDSLFFGQFGFVDDEDVMLCKFSNDLLVHRHEVPFLGDHDLVDLLQDLLGIDLVIGADAAHRGHPVQRGHTNAKEFIAVIRKYPKEFQPLNQGIVFVCGFLENPAIE